MTEKTKIAVFDIDGTIFRSSLLIEYVRNLMMMGIFPSGAYRKSVELEETWKNRNGTYEEYIDSVVEFFAQYIVGKHITEVKVGAMRTVEMFWQQNYRYTSQLLEQLQESGFTTLAVSASPHHIVEIFAKLLNFDYYFGTLYEERSGIFTGKLALANTVHDKSEVVRLWALQNNIEIDYPGSYAVGDTTGDTKMLEKVGHPVAFNPSNALYDIAIQKGWDIAIERKDKHYVLSQGSDTKYYLV